MERFLSGHFYLGFLMPVVLGGLLLGTRPLLPINGESAGKSNKTTIQHIRYLIVVLKKVISIAPP
jgi:hypothetical protein